MRHQGAPTDSTANAQYHADVLGLGLALGGNGAVTQVAAGGGCWTTDAGAERCEAISLDQAFQADGLAMVFDAGDRPDLASICQVGRLADITSIEVPQD